MPNAATTESSSACETTGTPVPLDYGYVWATGKRHAYFTLQETGSDGLDYTRVGFWILGHGEFDGPLALWINDQLTWKGDTTVDSTWMGWNWFNTLDYPKRQDMVFHFHAGCDAVIGSGLAPSSNGPDQGVDRLWSVFPPAIQPLTFHRMAYYGIMRKQPILWQTTGRQDDPSQWTDINPIGLWRGLKVRLFDASGNVTGYAFSRNPVWHWVDVRLRCELFPDYTLPFGGQPDALPSSVSARFNWPAIYASAQYCAAALPNGLPRFTGDYSFAQGTSLQAMLSQILLCCRAFERETMSQIAIVCDQPRSPVFTFSRQHILPGSFEASDEALQAAGNNVVAKFRDVLVPACNSIVSITNPTNGDPTVTTGPSQPGASSSHPLLKGDWIAIGGTDTVYDGEWQVSSVPDIINPGTPSEVDPTTFTITRKGNNFPASIGAGGAVGLLYSRFKERSPEFWHKNNMLANGALGLGIARARNKQKRPLDFATSTYDQISRIARYERDRSLGFDQTPYISPKRFRLKTSMFARDVTGALACGIENGDVVAVDSTASWPYQGDYEVVDPRTVTPPACEVSESDVSLQRATDAGSGEIELTLQSFDENYLYDTSDDQQAGWPSVPGSFPGNDFAYAGVPLANGGNFVFFTLQVQGGTTFQLPSVGYPAANVLACASPAGTNVAFHSATQVAVCDIEGNLLVVLIYADAEGHSWGGVANVACLTWLSPDVYTIATDGTNYMDWLSLTLLGGEEILFGFGIMSDGATITLPSGWSSSQCFATAYINRTDNGGDSHIMYLAGAWVDGSLGVHCEMADHSGDTWPGVARVIVFAWKNNMGTVTSQTLGAGTWLSFPLTDGSKFGIGCAKNLADSSTLTLPADAAGGSTLEAMVGPSDSFYTSSGGHAQGIGSCYLDGNNVVHCTFNDGSGDTWTGTADILAIYTVAATAPGTLVRVSPVAPSVSQSGIIPFSAVVAGNANQAVTWSVDGVAGGNATVGTIDSTGIYTAPTAPGSHTITATSVAVPAASGSSKVTVTGSSAVHVGVLGGGLIVDAGVGTVTVAPGNWQLAGGLVTLTADNTPPSGTYNVTVSWFNVSAIGPDGSTLNYTDGTAVIPSDQTGSLSLYDPTNAGGNLINLYIGSAGPTGSHDILDITSVPALGGTETFSL